MQSFNAPFLSEKSQKLFSHPFQEPVRVPSIIPPPTPPNNNFKYNPNQQNMIPNASVQQVRYKLKRLPFRIIYASSEDQGYSITQLSNINPPTAKGSIGWQSARFCQFPQIIVIQFPFIVNLKQAQFLSHQSKISQKIDLFTYVPDSNRPDTNEAAIPLHQVAWKKLGGLRFQNNARSHYSARQLKSVFTDNLAFAMKVVLHQNFQNPINLFNQIGIVQMNMYGNVATANVPHILDESALRGGGIHAPASKESLFYGISVFDSKVRKKLDQLKQEKMRALAKEDFGKARQLKEAIDQLVDVGYELASLQAKKKDAVGREEYKVAKVLKGEIDRILGRILLKAGINSKSFQDIQPTHYQNNYNTRIDEDDNVSFKTGKFASLKAGPQYHQSPTQSHFMKPIENIKVKTMFQAGQNLQNHPEMPLDDDLIMQDYNVINTIPKNGFENQALNKRRNDPFKIQASQGLGPIHPLNLNISQIFPQHQQNKMDNLWDRTDIMSTQGNKIEDDDNVSAKFTNFSRKNFESKKSLGFQQEPIPAIQNQPKPKDDFSLQGFLKHEQLAMDKSIVSTKRREDLPHAEALAGENAKKAGPLIPIFGEQTMKRFFSRNWGLRQDALKVVLDELQKDKGSSKLVREQSPDYLMLGVLGLIGFSIGDKIAQVSNQAFELLRRFDKEFFDSGVKLPKNKEAQMYPQLIIAGILQKIGDNNPRMRDLAQQTLMELSNMKRIFSLKIVVQNVMEIQNKKIQNSVKHLNGKARIMIALLTEKQKQFRGIKYPIDEIGDFAVKLSSHQNKDLRQISVELIVALYKIYGASATAKFNSKLKPAQKELVTQMIKKK